MCLSGKTNGKKNWGSDLLYMLAENNSPRSSLLLRSSLNNKSPCWGRLKVGA